MADNKKLIRAKVGLILAHPFYATMMLKRQFIETREVKTFCTNGDYIKYNPDLIEELSHDEIMAVICHEIMHITNLHHLRMGARDVKKWNKAIDYPVNEIIEKSGLKLPKWVLRDKKYSGMSAEQIYDLLPKGNGGGNNDDEDEEDGDGASSGGKQQKPNGKGKQQQQSIGDVEPAPVHTESERQQAEAQVRQEVAQAAQIAKGQGKLPGFMREMISEIMEPVVSWKEVLSRFITERAKNDYSFSRPNQRYIHSGFIMPSLYSEEIGLIALFVDSSGSTFDVATLTKFASEAQEVCNLVKATMKILYIDTAVAGWQDIEPDEEIKLDVKGGGGTDFRPGFKWLSENGIEPQAVIYFTDGDCSSFPEAPEYPVLWAVTGSTKWFKPPFGEVVGID